MLERVCEPACCPSAPGLFRDGPAPPTELPARSGEGSRCPDCKARCPALTHIPFSLLVPIPVHLFGFFYVYFCWGIRPSLTDGETAAG